MNIKTFEGEMVVDNAKFGIVISRFNSFLVESLLSGAIDKFMTIFSTKNFGTLN